MPRRCTPPRDAGPVVTALAVGTVASVVYLLAASCGTPPSPTHVPDGSCYDRVVYQTARLSDC